MMSLLCLLFFRIGGSGWNAGGISWDFGGDGNGRNADRIAGGDGSCAALRVMPGNETTGAPDACERDQQA